MASTAPLHQIRFPIDERTAADIDDNFIALFGRSFGFDDLGEDGILAPLHGGTGLGTYTIGDLLTASAADTLDTILAVQKGSVLISQGAAVEPVWSATGASGFVLTSQGAGSDPVWATAAHNLLSATHPDTTTGTVARGDVVTGQGASAKWTRLGVGTLGYFLRSFGAGADLAWSNDGALLTNIPESAINDDNLLARVAGNEIISGLWRFTQGASMGAAASADQFNVTLSKNGDYLSTLKNTSGANNYGLRIVAGSSSANNALAIDDAALLNNLLTLRGDGALSWGAGAFIASSSFVVGVHDILSATHTDALAAAVVRGDVIVGNATPKWSRLAIGTAGKMLRSDGTDASWSTDGSALTVLNASNLASGTVPLARIAGLTTTQFASAAVSQWTNDAGYLTSVTAHNLLSATHGDTLAAAVVRGDIVIGNSTPKWSRLAIGTAGKMLRTDGTDVSWSTDGSSLVSLNAGSLNSGTVPLARISALTTAQFASANVSQWTNDAGYLTAVTAHNLLSATHGDTLAASVVRGDVVIGNATPKWSRLAVGAAGAFLRSDATDVSWGVDGSALTTLNASNLASGTVPLARIAGLTTTQFASANISQWTNNSGYLTAVTAHNLLSATHGDTVAASPVRGDLVVGNSTPAWTKLATGAAGTVLIGGTDPSYSASPTLTGLTLSGMTEGSVIFAGVSGVLSQDNSGLFWDAANKRLGVNTTTPSADYEVVTTAGAAMRLKRYNAGTAGINLSSQRARGTSGVPADLVAGDTIGQWQFFGWVDAVGIFRAAATILVGAEANATAVNTPGFVDFETATGAGGGTTFAMRLTSTQRLGINTTVPASALDIAGATGGVVTISRRTDTSITAADVVGTIQFWAQDTSTTTNTIVANIEVQATNTVATDINPGRMIFRTTSVTVAATPTEALRIASTQNVSIGTGADGTAVLHLKAGTTAVSSAPLKFTSGTLLTTAEAGAVEFLTDDFYGTITTGAARKPIVLADAALTTGRVPFTTTNGRLTDSANLAWSGSLLTVTNGDIAIATLGKTLKIAEGSNAKMGTAVMVAGTVTVTTTAVTANSRIFLAGQTTGGTLGELHVSARTAGTSFVISSSSATDTRTIAWVLFEPA